MIFKYLQRDKSSKGGTQDGAAGGAETPQDDAGKAAQSGTEAETDGRRPAPAEIGAAPPALAASELRRIVDPNSLGFATTAELTAAAGLIGQERALEALAFGIDMKALDFNVFVLGPPASGKSRPR